MAGESRGLELWRLLIREHEAPEQPIIQREFQRQWQFPKKCKDAEELRARLPEWETLGQQLVAMTGHELDGTTQSCSLDALLPPDYGHSLGDKPELVGYSERLQFVKRRLGLSKHRALAHAAVTGGTTAMDVGVLAEDGPEAPQGLDTYSPEGLENFIQVLRRAASQKGGGKGGRLPTGGPQPRRGAPAAGGPAPT